jgi:uncharacterized membrane protein YhaH (DUF805 family)
MLLNLDPATMARAIRSFLSLFGLNGSVSRSNYFYWGCGLATLKYVVEVMVIGSLTGKVYTPLDYLTPLLSNRARFTEAAPTWLGVALVLWTLPFVWIAVAMSLRRCRDAGFSPWFGMVMLIPILNYLGMFVLSLLPADVPETEESIDQQRRITELWQPLDVESEPMQNPAEAGKNFGIGAAIIGGAAGSGYALLSTVLTIYVLDSYGSALFFGTPLVAGAVSAFLFNRPVRRSLIATIVQSTLMMFLCCCAFLLVGMEGAICIIMAVPILFPVGWMGAVIGRSIAIETLRPRRESRGMMWCLGCLPMLAAVEGLLVPKSTFAVKTAIDIKAEPATVWQQVIAFPDITEEPAWFFRTGISSPLRARIEGSGVGAIRYCEFTTGVFVEPITVWDEPHRLAFDVSEQPEPMFELTPYRHIHPPHLNGTFRSTQGEFLLEPMPNGATRLTGTTWYELQMYPHAYWTLWSDELVHQIHLRVLRHIREEAESK